MNKKKILGTDGVRGTANKHPMTPDVAMKVAQAYMVVMARKSGREDYYPHILIGKDTRRSGYTFEPALTAGLCSMGAHVLLTGPIPTPGASYVMRSMRCDGAIMITASHNAYYDNGIKFFDSSGFKLAAEYQAAIEKMVQGEDLNQLLVSSEKMGETVRLDDAVGRYVEFAKSTFPRDLRLDGLKIVVDCANGASYKAGPLALRELGARVVALSNDPDGYNINADCGSTYPQQVRSMIFKERANVGIAFDGDADRIIMCDEDGEIVDGNALLTLLALDLLKKNKLPGDGIVTNVNYNLGLVTALEPHGIKVVITDVGDSRVVEGMLEHGFILGGEDCGHMLLLEHNVTGDALIAALQVLAIMKKEGKTLSELTAVYQAVPEVNESVPTQGKPVDRDFLKSLQTKTEQVLNGQGKVVVRPSGTEPLVRIGVQHISKKKAYEILNSLKKEVESVFE